MWDADLLLQSMSQHSAATPLPATPPTPPLPTTAAFRAAVRGVKDKLRVAKKAEMVYRKAIDQSVREFRTSEAMAALKAARQEAIAALRAGTALREFRKATTAANLARGRLVKAYKLTWAQQRQILAQRRVRRRSRYMFNLGWRFRIII